jgi:dipeptidyl aminopeptidase/acylaminoacyl peptidase
MKYLISFSFFILLVFSIIGQTKKPLDIDALKKWESIKTARISQLGNVFNYEVTPNIGETKLIYGNLTQPKIDTVLRGYGAKVSPAEEIIIFKIKVPKALSDSIKLAKQNKLDGASKAKIPKDSIGIHYLAIDTLMKFPNVKSFNVPADSGSIFTVLLSKDYEKKEKAEKKESKENWFRNFLDLSKKGQTEEEPKLNKPSPQVLLVGDCYNPDFYKVKNVKLFDLSDAGNRVAYLKSNTDTLDSLEVWIYDYNTSTHTQVFQTTGNIKGLSFDALGKQMAFYHSVDTNKEKLYNLLYWKLGNDSVTELVSEPRTLFPSSYTLSSHAKLIFSEDGEKIFFGYGKTPKIDTKDTLLTKDKPQVDIWSWNDTYIQPMQKKMAERYKNKSYQAVMHVASRKIILIEDSMLSGTRLINKGNANFGFLEDEKSNATSLTWDINYPQNIYKVDYSTGRREIVLKENRYRYQVSTNGNYIAQYNADDKQWYLLDLATMKLTNITSQIPSEFHNKEHDTPAKARPYGVAGWTENDEHVLIYDEFDVWMVNTKKTSEFRPLTKQQGKKNQIRYRLFKVESDKNYYDLKNPILMTGFSEASKESGIYKVLIGSNPKVLFKEEGYVISLKSISRFANKLMVTKQNYSEYPDLYVTNTSFTDINRVSYVNKLQEGYIWATSEMVSWKATDGTNLEGYIVKPENFDSNKKYPMMVYFYERNSDYFKRYRSPRPSASIINPVHYASNGYVVFVPDITYTEGHPGKSAMNAIVSGTDHVVSLGYVNENKIGIQGQSWGGYQVAYLVTQTNKYAAAMAGAPVSNMTSAYGGVRWGSGMSRMFQYEQTQSRIGKTLWEGLDLYIENSPVFFADKVETPLLMMHNDNDGAVPWYQGIEYYMALRRLSSPVWMLTYNKEEHNLRKMPNKVDLTIRMKQFFDHYLTDAAKPVWMELGLPYEQKGVKTGYELMEKN